MKKGFTLIELLAVILILGIIALIAIPTVNKIISEARYGAFKSGNENIMKQVEQDCQTSMMKGETLTLSYLFTEGKLNNEINIKGSLPYDGYIILNRNCEITDYYLTDNKNVHSNDEDVREDYMLKPLSESQKSLFNTMYSDYYDKIISVDFINNLNIPGNAMEIKDPSVSEKGKIKSWLIPDGENYKLYIGSERNIYANYNSAYLFKDMISVNTIDFNNFKTSFTTNMQSMFQNNRLKHVDVNNFDTRNVENMSYVFWQSLLLESIDLSNWDTHNVIYLDYAFDDCKKIKEIDLSNWDTSNLKKAIGIFWGAQSLKIIKLSTWNTSNLQDIGRIFSNTVATEIDLSNWDLSSLYSSGEFITATYNLNTLIFRSAADVNRIANSLTTKTVNNPGKIIIKGNTDNLNKSLIESFNWYVYDKDGNRL
jgi:prepilin-type N-terminal cleavage/methylation domain-containing protein